MWKRYKSMEELPLIANLGSGILNTAYALNNRIVINNLA